MTPALPLRPAPDAPDDVLPALAAARRAWRGWAGRTARERAAVIEALRRGVAREAERLGGVTAAAAGRDLADTLAAEVLPLLDACRHARRRAPRLLAPRRPSIRHRPAWLLGSSLRIDRVPFGVVLVIAPANYPLMLPGIQAVQALAAGNAVLVKPAPGCAAPMAALGDLLREAGLPEGLFGLLDTAPDAAGRTIREGVDKVVLTGSAATGAAVLAALAPGLTPAVMELSGNDALIVLPGADPDAAADAVAFGNRLNAGRTCIAPRRVFVDRARAATLEARLAERFARLPTAQLPPRAAAAFAEHFRDAVARGARRVAGGVERGGRVTPLLLADVPDGASILTADVFAPVASLLPYDAVDEAVDRANACPYGLGASVFGPRAEALRVAARLNVGMVTVNDVVAPTADPRAPFGGRGRSGFGTTRGDEGLLAMTRPRAVAARRPGLAGLAFHLRRPPLPAATWLRLIRFLHGRG